MTDTNLKTFLRTLKNNFNTLKNREARFANSAPLHLLNQIDDYAQAIALTERALEENTPLATPIGACKNLPRV